MASYAVRSVDLEGQVFKPKSPGLRFGLLHHLRSDAYVPASISNTYSYHSNVTREATLRNYLDLTDESVVDLGGHNSLLVVFNCSKVPAKPLRLLVPGQLAVSCDLCAFLDEGVDELQHVT